METSTATRIPTAAHEAPSAESAVKRSAVEGIKENSRQLRGTIALDLVNEADHFSEADKQLLKFHGTYQQEDRDARKTRRKDGVGKHHMFMVRCKIPGGRLTAKQYLAVDDIAGAHANGTLRFTSRQGIQFHGVLKSQLRETIADINACLLSTLGACGDVERNVMACPAPHHHDGVHAQLQETAKVLAAHLAPRTRAYHEIWLNGQPVGESASEADVEPLYGKVYLPRKFKTGLALPQDNCIDVYAQDLGLLAIVEDGTIVGYNVIVGGGMGMTHGNANTFPHLGRPICYVPAQAVVGAAEAVVKLFRDHGNRADRKRARIKYLVHDWGVEKFRRTLSDYIGGPLHEPRPLTVSDFDLHLGWHPQGDGKCFYGLSIENGRVKDEGSLRLRSGLRALVERFQAEIRLTPLQDILLCDLPADAKGEIDKTLAEYGIPRPDTLSNVQKHSMACPAVPTCGLAISESERALPNVVDQLEIELKRLGLEQERISVRMTGCPNGCVRPYQSDIGIVGRSGDKYTLFVGGHTVGHRLNFVLKDLVPLNDLVPTVLPVLENFKRDRRRDETFGDYCQRRGAEQLQALLPSKTPSTNGAQEGVLKARKDTNGDTHHATTPTSSQGQGAALAEPETRAIPLAVPEPKVTSIAPIAIPRSETIFAGPSASELRDYSFRHNSDGSVRETVVYFYDGDLRAAAAQRGAALRRKAVYSGRANPQRLHEAIKRHDTFYAGSAGHECRNRRIDYLNDGQVARTIVFYYEGDARAAVVPSGKALRRQVAYAGLLPT